MDSVHVLFDDLLPAAMHTSCMPPKDKKVMADEIAMECGRRLVECRNERKMTQEQLSKATGYSLHRKGLSPSQIGNFEQGTRRIGVEEAEILARVFANYPAAYFMGVVDKREARLIIALRTDGDSFPKAS